MKFPPRLIPKQKDDVVVFQEQRVVPRFPLPKDQVKIIFEDQTHKVCALRDLSARGVGITLLEHSEVLLFPLGQEYLAEIKVSGRNVALPVTVRRVSAWSVGFEFTNPDPATLEEISEFLNPMVIGRSLKKISLELNPEVAAHGISSWYHGDMNTDLYFWSDARGGVERLLLCVGSQFLEWKNQGLRTGDLEREEGDEATLRFDASPKEEIKSLCRKVLEHAEALDYRLVSFLKDQMR